jgi:PAS domain S-box-containing protein
MQATRSSYTRLPSLLMILLVAAGYFVLARLSLILSFESSNATPVWPPSGFAFAMILVLGYRVAPGILIGAFSANLVVFQANHTTGLSTAVLISFIISIGNMGEALAGNYILRKMIPGATNNNYFNTVSHIFKFLLTALLMCLVSSIVGATTVFLGDIITQSQYSTAWLTWWMGDISGILLITPFLVVWINYFRAEPVHKSVTGRTRVTLIENLSLLILAILASGIVFDNWFFIPSIFRWAFWIIPVVVWAAVRFRQHETITAIAVCSIIAIWGTINNHGPFSVVPLNQSLLIVQAFISIIVITALTLNASILERNQTEEALRSASDQLDLRVKERTTELEERNIFIETLFDSVEDLMAVFDTKGNYLSINKKIETLYKVRRNDMIGKNILEIYPELKSSEMYENLQKAIRGEMVHHLSYRSTISQRYFENFYIPLRNNKQEVYSVLVIGHDNTPVMEAAEKIEEINTRLNEAQRLAHIGSWRWDIPGNRISWSDELYRIFGINKGESESNYENYLGTIHPEDRPFVNETVGEALDSKQPFDFYHRIIRPDGKERMLHSRGEVITNDKNEALAMSGTAQDVTEIKLAEEELKQMANEVLRYNKELEQINKELESFTFVASHDLQEPLRKIRTFLTLIEEKELASLSETSKDYLRRTVKAAGQMQQLITDLLTYSRTTGSEEHFKRTDLNEVLQQVKNELKEMIEDKKADIETDRLPVLHVIPFQFQQLFINLLSNSIKFSKPGIPPQIRIRYEIAEAGMIKNLNNEPDKRYHLLSITDNGIGFDTKYNEKVFGLFQRLNSKHTYSGTGIGLSICKKIVENHDGIITAMGEKDKGTTIQIYLPD